MNELTKFLVEGILNEAPEKVVALFGGGFKPPTKGHLDVVNQGIKQNPEVSEVKILVGGGERNGFTQDQAIKIWNLYNDIGFIDKPATIIPVSSPFTFYKNYLKDNPDDKVYVFVGSRPDDEKDQMDVKQRSEFVKKYSDNVIPVEVSTTGGVSGTLARKLFKTDIDSFRNMFPENLLDIDFKKILDILNNKSTDNTRKSTPKATEPLTPLNEDPKKGTGKKPKGSGRRLYTDENPKDTVGIKFSTRQDIVDTLGKKSFKAKSHARQSQIINLIHQRVRAALGRTKDPAKKKKLKSGFEYIKGKKEASKKKTQRLKKQKLKENKLSLDDTILLSKTLRDKDKMKQIHSLLVQMFPKQKDFLDYNYKNDQFNDFRPFIFYIDEYIFEGPKLVPHTELKLDPDAYAEREKKYKKYIEGKIDKYFNSSNSDPRKVDLSKVPPITIDAEGMVAGGNHRAFLAIKQQKPLKAYQVVKANNTHPNVEKILNIIGRKKQKLKENQMSMEDFNLVGAVLRDKNKAKEIHNLLLQMFPKQKELLNYNYKNDSYAEFKRVIFHIDKYNIEGPKLIQHTKLKLDPGVYKERDRKYEEYAKGKIKKYFRDSDSDPRTLDLSKLPPITIDSNGEVMDGNHRAFLAIKQQKPLKAYQIIDAKNTHPNVEKILNIVGKEKQKLNEDVLDQTNLVLPRGKKIYLQAEEEDYNRGLIVELSEEGGYKINYWYGDDAQVYPVEVEIDGESIKPDAKEVYVKFHPYLKNENIDPESQKKHKGKSAPFGSAYKPVNEQETTYKVIAKGVVFEPKNLTINVGDTVKWVNEQGVHNVNGKKSHERNQNNPESFGNKVGSGWTYEFTFNKPGLYKYHCDPHLSADMVGTIKVKNKVEEGDTYEKMAAKGKKAGSLKQGTVRKRLKIPKDKKIPLSKINKELSRLKKMDKDKDKKGVQLGDKNQKYYKALQLSKTLKTTTNINENATYSSKIDYKQQIKDLTKHMLKKGMNIQPLPRVIFKHGDQENASQFLGKTAYYSPSDMTVVLYTEGRHPKDIARSFAHEMIHHIQNLEGRLGGINTTNTNQDDNLNDIEREAYTRGNMVFRNWTDNMDGEEVSSLNEKIVGEKIECDNCGWSWNIVDGGDDLFICHKCGHDNEPENGDPFGLKAYARELVKEVFSKTVTIDMGPILQTLEFEMPTGQETDENIISIIDAAPQGKVPHPVFLDFYAKFDKYFGEENDDRMLDNFGLKYLLSNVLNLPSEDIQIVMNHYNTTDQDNIEWFEQHDNELEKDEEHTIPGFEDANDDHESVINYRKKQLAKSLEEQEKVRIFNPNCGCDKT